MAASSQGRWEFLPNPGREQEGLGHAGIETFKGSPFPGIARECSQNSLDAAARRSDGSIEPVHLVFRLLNVPAADVPGLAALRDTLSACLAQAQSSGLKKELEFFQRAVSVASSHHVPVLSIEDYGTTGLRGPAVEGKPFHALVKSSGVSQKADSDAGGSFGIGKNAAFAISSLRTVFYSTLYQEASHEIYLAQGKSILVSHEDRSGHKRATGYWGGAEYMPVSNQEDLPSWMRRTSVGTTVASIGFYEEPEWPWLITESLVRNFFSAVSGGSIRFSVVLSDGNLIEINPSTLADLFSAREVRSAAENSGTTEDLDFSAAMLEAISSSESEVKVEAFENIGTFRLKLLQREGLPRRVGILRNGMYIADSLRHFNHPMVRFPMSRDFVAVLEPHDRATSGRVRDMESPRHDEISAERIDDAGQRRRLKVAMKKVGDWIRGTIKAATTKPAEADILLDEMNRFFSKAGDGQSIPDPTNINTDPESAKLERAKIPPQPLLGNGPRGDSGSSGGQKEGRASGGKTVGDRVGSGRGVVGGRGGSNVQFAELRNSALAQGKKRRIAFTPLESGDALVEVAAVGVSSDEPLRIISVDGKPCAAAPRVELRKGVRASIEVEFESPYSGPISLVLAIVKAEDDAN